MVDEVIIPEEGTLLIMDGMGIPLYSARVDVVQTLVPIDQQKQLVRTINGELIDVSNDEFQLYKSTISCTDNNPAALDGIWRGRQIIVDCVVDLVYETGGTPQRAVVPDSSRTIGGFTHYKPRLEMTVTDFQTSFAEGQAAHSWQIDLEETGPTPFVGDSDSA